MLMHSWHWTKIEPVMTDSHTTKIRLLLIYFSYVMLDTVYAVLAVSLNELSVVLQNEKLVKLVEFCYCYCCCQQTALVFSDKNL